MKIPSQIMKRLNKTQKFLLSKAKGFSIAKDGIIINLEATEETIKEFLGKNIKNRKKTDSRIAIYATKMQRGEWTLSNDMLVIDRHDVCRNGQHRGLAFLVAGCPSGVEFFVFLLTCSDEKADEIVKNMDIGKTRKYSDTLVLRGICEAKYADRFETLARKVGYIAAGYTSYPVLDESDLDAIIDSYFKEFSVIAPLFGKGFIADMAAAACVVLKLSGKNDKVATMIKLAKGDTGLVEGDPVTILHRVIAARNNDVAQKHKGHNSLHFAAAGNCFVAKVEEREMCCKCLSLEKFMKWIDRTSKEKGIPVVPSCVYETVANYKKVAPVKEGL